MPHPFGEEGVKPLQKGFFCPESLLSAPVHLEAAEKFCCCWLSAGRDELSNLLLEAREMS